MKKSEEISQESEQSPNTELSSNKSVKVGYDIRLILSLTALVIGLLIGIIILASDQTEDIDCDPGEINYLTKCRDIDECQWRTHNCTILQKCINTPTSYQCHGQ